MLVVKIAGITVIWFTAAVIFATGNVDRSLPEQ
jgi:hypothetical protein